MFNFFKKHKPQDVYEIREISIPEPKPEPKLKLSVRERALKVFSKIEGLDDIKEIMLRSLESEERAHTLLTGPPASAKSLFAQEIEKMMKDKVYYANGDSTTKAGIQKYVAENQDKEIIIIDEIDKMSVKDQEGLLNMMERGEFTITKVRNTKTVKANVIIFATSNSTERLSKPLLSRFAIFEIPEYTYPEFEAISIRVCKKLPQSVAVQIASAVWKNGSKDVRDCIKISKLATAKDTEEDINRLIAIHQKHKTGREFIDKYGYDKN